MTGERRLSEAVLIKVSEARQRIIQVLEECRCIAVCYSGGKDSTLVTHLLLESLLALRSPPPQAHVLLVDTGVEIPRLALQARTFIAKVAHWAQGHGLPVRCHVLSPDIRESYWFLLLGKGYPAPTPWFRWCVKRLKINPVRRFLNGLETEVVVLLGSRREESDSRKRSVDVRRNGGYWMPFEGVPRARAFLPILDWTAAEVWEFLLKSGPLWGGQYRDLFGLYWDALDECLFRPSDKTFSCNGRRFGCWTCTVVKRDQTMQNLAAAGDDALEKLLAFKEHLREASRSPSRRIGVTRRGKPGPGPLTAETRKQLLESLKALQAEVGLPLISANEEALIRQFWETDPLIGARGRSSHGHRGSDSARGPS